MPTLVIVTDCYFDGARHHSDGPFSIVIADGLIEAVHRGDTSAAVSALSLRAHDEATTVLRAPFVMPGLVEAHCHLFLDGAP